MNRVEVQVVTGKFLPTTYIMPFSPSHRPSGRGGLAGPLFGGLVVSSHFTPLCFVCPSLPQLASSYPPPPSSPTDLGWWSVPSLSQALYETPLCSVAQIVYDSGIIASLPRYCDALFFLPCFFLL